MGNLLSIVVNTIVWVGVIYFIILRFRKKPLIEKPEEIKTRIRIILETVAWVGLAIITLLYAITRAKGSILYYFVEIFWMTMIGFYVYDDSRKRYQKSNWNISWGIAVGIFFPLFLCYFYVRPSITLEAQGTPFGKKIIFSIGILIVFLLLMFLLNAIFHS